MAIHLCGPPGEIGRAGPPTFDLAPGGGCRAAGVTPDAGALLPHRFTLACAAEAAIGGLLSVALIRQVAPSWLSPAPCPLEPRLSSTWQNHAAAIRPAHRRYQSTGPLASAAGVGLARGRPRSLAMRAPGGAPRLRCRSL